MSVFKKLFILFIAVAFSAVMLSSCETESENVALGTAAGSGIGALVSHNHWKGAFLGAMAGAVAGEAMYQIQQKAINQAINSQRHVVYQRRENNGGWQQVEAEPVGRPVINPDKHTKCQKVHIREINNGKVVKDTIREVCKGYKETNTY